MKNSSAMLPMCQDVPILAKEAVYREWVTAYQVEQILAGNAASLFRVYILQEPLGEAAWVASRAATGS
jgi:hypothetical protein